MLEYWGDCATNTPIQIFATDISDVAIEKARARVYNAVDPQRFDPCREEVGQAVRAHQLRSKCVIGFVSSLHPWQGVETLIAAFSRLQTVAPNTHLLMVGDGPEREKRQNLSCKLTVRTLNLENRPESRMTKRRDGVLPPKTDPTS